MVNTKKGSFHSVMYEKALPVRKGVDAFIVKRTELSVRFGVEYDNVKAVQVKRVDGTLPSVNAGLPWGAWKHYGYFIENKGKVYARMYTVPNTKPKTKYFLNGREVAKETIEPMCLKSAFSSHSEIDCFTIDVENILAIE